MLKSRQATEATDFTIREVTKASDMSRRQAAESLALTETYAKKARDLEIKNASTTYRSERNYIANQTAANIAGSILGAGRNGAQLFMMSDRRLKRDVVQIGVLASGLPVYRYRYLWDDQQYVGVMADEAAVLFPAAVTEIGGYLAVNYAAIA